MHEHKEDYHFSIYPENCPFHNKKSKRKVGKFKDECKGVAVSEVCSIIQKAYSVLIADDKEIYKAKGVQNSVVKKYFIPTCIKSVFLIHNNSDMSQHLSGVTIIKWEYTNKLKKHITF